MIENPGNTHPYHKVWALLSIDEKGNEGILGLSGPMGPMQAITGSLVVFESMKAAIRHQRKRLEEANITVVVAEYTRTSTSDL